MLIGLSRSSLARSWSTASSAVKVGGRRAYALARADAIFATEYRMHCMNHF